MSAALTGSGLDVERLHLSPVLVALRGGASRGGPLEWRRRPLCALARSCPVRSLPKLIVASSRLRWAQRPAIVSSAAAALMSWSAGLSNRRDGERPAETWLCGLAELARPNSSGLLQRPPLSNKWSRRRPALMSL